MPRSIFSDKQHSMFEWALQGFGVSKVPNERAIKIVMDQLQNDYSIKTIHYQGALGHVYYANNLAQIISQVSETVYMQKGRAPHVLKGNG